MSAVDKTLRIMVAHEQHVQRLTVEKYLNCIGYYRVAPVGSLREVFILTRPPAKAFDLLIISRELYAAGESGTFFGTNDAVNIHSVLIYDDQKFLTREQLLVNTLGQHQRSLLNAITGGSCKSDFS